MGKHNKLRDILIEYNNPEYGDCIIDDICKLFNYNKDFIDMSGDFVVNNSDFDIKIPKIVRKKVSETIQVSFHFNMKKK